MKKIGILFFSGGMISCTYLYSVEPTYTCNPQNPPLYSDIQSIVLTKCATNGCHNGSRSTIPILITEKQFAANRLDSHDQLSNDAMPPTGAQPLTAFEKSEILCWINSGTK